MRLATGDLFLLGCAVVFTGHILVIDYFAPKVNGVWMSCIQFLVAGIISAIPMVFTETPTWEAIWAAKLPILYAGVMSCGVAYTLQIVGQNGVNPTVAALLMSLESVVATITGVIAFKIGFLKVDQTMTLQQVAGCVIVFMAVILVQLPKEWFEKKKR